MDNLDQINRKNCININIGVLGHIDSGKTSLVKYLSKITSTASLDKNPQSQERGITLDLGFSAFYIPFGQDQYYQFTLVDCPGHASLIKTIIGGAQIIDLMFLVVDVNKGIQTQTAECLVIGEILTEKMIVILNKIDLATEDHIKKTMLHIQKVFSKTKFSQNVPIIPVSAITGQNIQLLLDTLMNNIQVPQRQLNIAKPLLLMVDHCFQIKGQGTVTTGTILQGTIKPGDEVYFPNLNITKKVKSLQMFKKPVDVGNPGDRIAALFTNLEAKDIERGIVSKPGVVQNFENIVININRIQYYKASIKSQNKFHITSGHLTVMGQIKLFLRPKNLNLELNMDGEYLEELDQFDKLRDKYNIFGLLQLEKPLLATQNSLVIASKLDTDLEANLCRIAFYGNILLNYNHNQIFQDNFIKLFRKKTKVGQIEKIIDDYTLLITGLFKKDTNINNFINKSVIIKSTLNQGKIQGAFGKSGKVKVTFENGVLFNLQDQQQLFATQVVLVYKKYLFHK